MLGHQPTHSRAIAHCQASRLCLNTRESLQHRRYQYDTCWFDDVDIELRETSTTAPSRGSRNRSRLSQVHIDLTTITHVSDVEPPHMFSQHAASGKHCTSAFSSLNPVEIFRSDLSLIRKRKTRFLSDRDRHARVAEPRACFCRTVDRTGT